MEQTALLKQIEVELNGTTEDWDPALDDQDDWRIQNFSDGSDGGQVDSLDDKHDWPSGDM